MKIKPSLNLIFMFSLQNPEEHAENHIFTLCNNRIITIVLPRNICKYTENAYAKIRRSDVKLCCKFGSLEVWV